MSSSQRPPPDNTQHTDRQTDMQPVGLEPIIPAIERPQADTLDHVATGPGDVKLWKPKIQGRTV